MVKYQSSFRKDRNFIFVAVFYKCSVREIHDLEIENDHVRLNRKRQLVSLCLHHLCCMSCYCMHAREPWKGII